MKKKFSIIAALLLVVAAVFAVDLKYTTLPQDTDDAVVRGNKLAAIQTGASNKFSNLTSAATTTVKTGSGVLDRIVINTGASTTTVTVYDNTAASGTKIATASTTAQGVLTYNCRFGTGLTVVTSGTADLTVVYR